MCITANICIWINTVWFTHLTMTLFGKLFLRPASFQFLNRQKITWATKKTTYFPLYWLFIRDPYNGLLYALYDWVVLSPIVYPKQTSFFHCSLGGVSNHYLRQFSRCPTFNSRRDTKRRKVSFFGERKHGNTLPALGKSLVYIRKYIYIYICKYPYAYNTQIIYYISL